MSTSVPIPKTVSGLALFSVSVQLAKGLPLHRPGDGGLSLQDAGFPLPQDSLVHATVTGSRLQQLSMLAVVLYCTCKLCLLVPVRSGENLLLLHPTILKCSSGMFEE